MRDSYASKKHCRHTKCGRMRGMVVGEGGRSSGVLLYHLSGACGVIERLRHRKNNFLHNTCSGTAVTCQLYRRLCP